MVEDTRGLSEENYFILNEKHHKIIEKLRVIVLKSKIIEFVSQNSLAEEFQFLLEKHFILELNNKLLSLFTEPYLKLEIEKKNE